MHRYVHVADLAKRQRGPGLQRPPAPTRDQVHARECSEEQVADLVLGVRKVNMLMVSGPLNQPARARGLAWMLGSSEGVLDNQRADGLESQSATDDWVVFAVAAGLRLRLAAPLDS